ncbi:MAG: 5-(carboxyamino)imidazole ribonucleotide synthase [Alphaproteobacteria bacterium]|nr:5-(carboxyamino)imidazole ribonucleotide synthase [Alphaproteobacteria bacterium]MBV8548847.1 5-(carboxyamino)imidazole ribonucleotide synthase [Alphaproteobacteria bacterium]
MAQAKIITPGATIGILGGGQLGRMTALAAAQLGYKTHIFCSAADEPALDVTAHRTLAQFDDVDALRQFAQSVDVVTLEWENVPAVALETVAKYAPLHPGASVMAIAQDRQKEKDFARSVGIGTTRYKIVQSAAELAEALKKIPAPAFLKTTRMGYDGKGQIKITPDMDAEQAWAEFGNPLGILEARVDFACEVSVIVARNAQGDMAAYPVVENRHKNQILDETHAPAAIDAEISAEAVATARHMAAQLGVIGLLAVELFVLREPNGEGQSVLLNEIAPRPHNSGHWTMDACAVSQFEQLVRAVCGLPLGSTEPHSAAVMKNLIGNDALQWQQYLSDRSACLHLYGKRDVRDGRKMGHVNSLKGPWPRAD